MFKDDLAKAMDIWGLTQTTLARELGISTQTVSAWCNGHSTPDEDNYRKVVALLEMDYDDSVVKVANRPFSTKTSVGEVMGDFDIQKFKRMRLSTQRTRGEFAELVGLSVGTIKNWEEGKVRPSLKNLAKINKYFNTTNEFWRKEEEGNEPFAPKPQVDPKVKERESKWKNPYKAADAPVISTPVVEMRDLTDEEIEEGKKLVENMASERLELKPVNSYDHLKEKIELMEFDYKLQDEHIHDRINALEKENKELHEALDGIRKLIVGHLLEKNGDAQAVGITDKADVVIVPQKKKKSFWARLWE